MKNKHEKVEIETSKRSTTFYFVDDVVFRVMSNEDGRIWNVFTVREDMQGGVGGNSLYSFVVVGKIVFDFVAAEFDVVCVLDAHDLARYETHLLAVVRGNPSVWR